MARRSDHSREELEALVLEKAWDIVGADGFEGLTARRLAKDIGYAPGTIYNLFQSMDDLYLRVNARTLDMLYDILAGTAQSAGPPGVKSFELMAARYMAFARDYRPYWQMLFSHRLPEGRKLEHWYQEKIDRLFEPLESLLAPYFTPRQTRKCKIAARVLWSSVHGLCFLQETGKITLVNEKAGAEDMASYLIDIFIAGIESGRQS